MSLLGSPLRKCVNIPLKGPMIMTVGFFVLFRFDLIFRFGYCFLELTMKDHRVVYNIRKNQDESS